MEKEILEQLKQIRRMIHYLAADIEAIKLSIGAGIEDDDSDSDRNRAETVLMDIKAMLFD